MDYTTKTSFTGLTCSDVAALGSSESFLPRHMGGGLVYRLATISSLIMLFFFLSFGCVHPEDAGVGKIVQGICINSM